MKKFLIMFAILLGSVATMQAQSNVTFDFRCDATATTPWGTDHLPAGFTQPQADILFAVGLVSNPDSPTQFTLVDPNNDIFDAAELIVEIVNSEYEVYDGQGGGDEFQDDSFATFEEALAHVRLILGINDIRGIRLSNGGIWVATSDENPYEALVGTSIEFDISAYTNLEDGTLPSDVVFSLPASTHALHSDDVSINGNILTVTFNSSSVFQIRIYASSEITGQSKSDIRFLTESFRGTN